MNASSEIICHTAGVAFLCPNVSTIIDIGGQDSKVVQVSKQGKVADFVMNDRCAAGTGKMNSFIEGGMEQNGVAAVRMSQNTHTIFVDEWMGIKE